ncbi:unnamed protein product [Rotaria sp. Silwood2]|nr:unnamed protein product [Rotaria sp. Silwood2]CAF4404442.1 unnamed protein product [Rotaria sp. Silwood2]
MIDSIDPALYRPGRLDTLIEVGEPDAKGRSDIFNIYTKTLLQNSLLSDDINIERLVQRTHGMTGAHIEQLVRRATHSDSKRDLQSRRTLHITDEETEELQIKNIDFTVALA